ncbi:MAG: hypothetical protein LBE27_05055 [Deltaproteobacteria bacterium]|jgi:hypothetical protein|nr:hypothetical protein [Deltaproteobacteria bacterium]
MNGGTIRYLTKLERVYGFFQPNSGANGSSKEKDSQNEISLGIVIDKEKHIFHNPVKGYFIFDPVKGFVNDPSLLRSYLRKMSPPGTFDFDLDWIYHDILLETGYLRVIKKAFPDMYDSIIALMSFKLLWIGTNEEEATLTYNASYTKLMNPEVKLTQSSLDKILRSLGTDEAWERFTKLNLKYVSKRQMPKAPVIVGCDYTKNCDTETPKPTKNQGGALAKDPLFILVTDQATGKLIYFRLTLGNIKHANVIKEAIDEIESFKIPIDDILLDISYFSPEFLKNLPEFQIPEKFNIPGKYSDQVEGSKHNVWKMFHLPNTFDPSNTLRFLKEDFLSLSSKPRKIKGDFNVFFVEDDGKGEFSAPKTFQHSDKTSNPKVNDNDQLPEPKTFILGSYADLTTTNVSCLFYAREAVAQFLYLSDKVSGIPKDKPLTGARLKGNLLLSFLTFSALDVINDYMQKLKNEILKKFE